MDKIIRKLKDGDLRSIGNVPEVVDTVLANPELFPPVLSGMNDPDPGVRMRSADAVEKISRHHPEFLQPYKGTLMEIMRQQSQQEVRWHIAQMVPRLELDDPERAEAAEVLFSYLNDQSKIVQTNAIQALVDLAWDDDQLFKRVKIAVEQLVEIGSPAVKNRAGKLLPGLVRKQMPDDS